MSMKCIVDVRSMKQQTLSAQRMILAEGSWYAIMRDCITVFPREWKFRTFIGLLNETICE